MNLHEAPPPAQPVEINTPSSIGSPPSPTPTPAPAPAPTQEPEPVKPPSPTPSPPQQQQQQQTTKETSKERKDSIVS